MAQGQVLHDCDLIFLMSGELQVRLGATSNGEDITKMTQGFPAKSTTTEHVFVFLC